VQHQVLAHHAGGIGQAIGKAEEAEFSNSRGVPMPFAAMITTSAGWNRSTPFAS